MENQLVKNLDMVVKPLKNALYKIKNAIEETSRRQPNERVTVPNSWIKAVRQAYNMPLSVIAKKIGKTPQAIMEFEKSEETRKISLENLSKIASAMDMELIYGFVPKKYYSLNDLLQNIAWYKTQENIRSKKERLGISFNTSNALYTKKKKESAMQKAAKPPKSLWK